MNRMSLIHLKNHYPHLRRLRRFLFLLYPSLKPPPGTPTIMHCHALSSYKNCVQWDLSLRPHDLKVHVVPLDDWTSAFVFEVEYCFLPELNICTPVEESTRGARQTVTQGPRIVPPPREGGWCLDTHPPRISKTPTHPPNSLSRRTPTKPIPVPDVVQTSAGGRMCRM